MLIHESLGKRDKKYSLMVRKGKPNTPATALKTPPATDGGEGLSRLVQLVEKAAIPNPRIQIK